MGMGFVTPDPLRAMQIIRAFVSATFALSLLALPANAKTVDRGINGGRTVIRDAIYPLTLANGETESVHLVYYVLVNWHVTDDGVITIGEQRFSCSFTGDLRQLYRSVKVNGSQTGDDAAVKQYAPPPNLDSSAGCNRHLADDAMRLATKYAGGPAVYKLDIDSDIRTYLSKMLAASMPKLRLKRLD